MEVSRAGLRFTNRVLLSREGECRPDLIPSPRDGERPRTVAEGGDLHIHSLEQRDIKIGQWRFPREANMPTTGDGAAAAACQKNRKVIMGMGVAVADAASVSDHAVVQQGAGSLWDRPQLF